MTLDDLRQACAGPVTAADSPEFSAALTGDLWNRLVPDRRPDLVVRAAGENDVVAAVRYARANRLKVVVRGGGHNWCQPTLRQGGVLIDLQDLNEVISLDVENRRAVIQPILSNRDVQRTLNPHGLAFPSGHCPQVKVSGYLLGGGMAWNPTVWGSGAGSVEAIEVVTADGELILANATENSDYFWAARGAGYGFFGVVTRYHLRLVALPRAIWGCAYFFALDDAAAVGTWLGEMAPQLSASIELSLFLVQAPDHLQNPADGGKICLVTATAFEDSPEAARAALAVLDRCPVQPLSRDEPRPYDFDQLFDASGALWPEGVRAKVEATFSNTNPGEMVAAIRAHIVKAPSPTTVFLFTIFCGANVPAPPLDAALSMTGKVYGGPWTMWWEAQDDAANAAWHQTCVEILRPFNVGTYIGESNPVDRPATAAEAFAPANWHRLAELRREYDPDGIFFGFFEGFGAGPA